MLRIFLGVLFVTLSGATYANANASSSIVCRYQNEQYPLGKLMFFDSSDKPFYCAKYNSRGIWRNFKGFSMDSTDIWLDEEGNVYPFDN